MFILIAVDYGETCDGHTRKLGIFKSKRAAEKSLDKDMIGLHDSYVRQGHTVDLYPFTRELWVDGRMGEFGTVWDIHKI